jgi:hypothetical protein
MPFPPDTTLLEEPEIVEKPSLTPRQASSKKPFWQRLQHRVVRVDLSVSPGKKNQTCFAIPEEMNTHFLAAFAAV